MYCAFKSSTFVRKIQANNQIINYYDNEHSEKTTVGTTLLSSICS